MVIKKVVRGIGLVLVMMSVALIVMGAAPSISFVPPTPADGATVTVNYVNVNVTLGESGTALIKWDANENVSMIGSGMSYYYNKIDLSNGLHTYIVFANDTTPENWSSSQRTVFINVPAPLIINFEPTETTVNSVGGNVQIFNVTVDQDASVSWRINDVEYQNNSVTANAKSEFGNSSLPQINIPSIYTVSAMAINPNGTSSPKNWTWTVTSPVLGPVKDLHVAGKGATWINWTWTNPEAPFDHTIVKINGTYQTNTTNNFYNYASFSPGTLNTITLQTVDTSGNIYPTPSENQSVTYNTPTGNLVTPQVIDNLKIIFDGVTTEGNTSVSAFPTLQIGENPPATFSPLGKYYYITTTGVTFSNAVVEIGYIPAGYNESLIRLYHWNAGTSQWDNVTTFLDITNDKVRGNVTGFSPLVVGAPPIPSITKIDPTGDNVTTIGKEAKTFKVSVNQDANITWVFGSNTVNTSSASAGQIEFTYTPSSTGTYNFSVTATNINGSDTKSWNWMVHSKTYASGNRVWDASKDMSLTYSWSPMSFYAFYYDVDDNIGNESLQINLDSGSRTVRRDQLIYNTEAENVSFKFTGWGGYDVIGFMADKYFAGYTQATNNSITRGTPVSTIGYSQLHKVLMDDRDTHTIRTSTTYPLGDGYAVTLKDIGAGREAMVAILKDNAEVYFDIVSVGDTFLYTKKVGSASDLPLIVMHIGSVFQGTSESMVQIDGIFQISESYTSATSSNSYGMMEITDTSNKKITMKNKNSFTLSAGSTVDIMGDMKFIVADNDVLRFAPMIKRSGEYEVRGTISNNENESEWTPLNFEGFYYNLDEDVGTERLTLKRSGRTVNARDMVYNTSAKEVNFTYSRLGKYNVIGFMADKYFAGYSAGNGITTKGDALSTIDHNQLHKVLIDDDTQRVIYAGSTLTLNDGYVIKIKDVNMGAGTASVWLVVLKDGTEVFDDIKENGQVFKYEKNVGAVKDLPIIAIRIDNIFRGQEATAAFIKGTFQLQESYTSVSNGDKFGKMEVTEVTGNQIKMTNPAVMTLSSASTIDFMNNIKFKVADSSDIRFYPYIMVNGSALAANQLAIKVPSSMMVKDTITISVTSGSGVPADNAELSFDGQVIGTTNSTGKLDYMLTKAGQHNITATKLGYEKAAMAVQIAEYVDNRLNFEMPDIVDQYIPVTIKVKVSGTGNYTSGANITLDGAGIGTTDPSGALSYSFTASGKHNLAASKTGFVSVQRDIDIRLPFTEFKALDINFTPNVVAKGQNVFVWSNITNTGTKEGTLPVALIINNTVVDNSNVTLAPGKQGMVNFTHKIELVPGNYSIEILGQKTTMPVKEEPLNLFIVAGAITGIGIIAFVLTSKNLMNIETVNKAVSKTKSGLGSLTSKFTKKGGASPPK